ncbi:Yip1 family protein [Acetobacterium malicum]|uniref:Yip1 family protein n=1 Tax=Acetobacterium malicum TaxID=52692 RepID=UPI00359477E6
MRNAVDLIIHPKRFFANSREREISIIAPIIILIMIGIVDGIVVAGLVNHTTIYDRLNPDAPVISATTMLFSMLMGSFSVYALILIQTVVFNLIMKKMGGTGTRKQAFYILGLASFPALVEGLFFIFFPQTFGLFQFENFHFVSLLIYNFLNIFNIWGIYLLIVGFAKVYDVSYKKASVLYLQFLIKMIPLFIIYLIVS